MIGKMSFTISNIQKFSSEVSGVISLAERSGNKEEQINILRQTISTLIPDKDNDIVKDVEILKSRVIPFDKRKTINGVDNRLTAFDYFYAQLVAITQTINPRLAAIYALESLEESIRYIDLLSKHIFIPLLYPEIYSFTTCEEYIDVLRSQEHFAFYFYQIKALEDIGIAVGVFSPFPDLLHWDEEFPAKSCINLELPPFTPPYLINIISERKLFNEEMETRLNNAIATSKDGVVSTLLQMKLALFYFQNGFSKKALKIALDVGKMFRSLFHFSRAYYSFILAFHCTSSNKKKVYILLQLLSLPPFKSNDDEMLFSKHYNVIGHHLLSQKQVNIELNALFPLVENIKIDAKYVFKVSFQPTMLTSCIPLPLQCKINNVETTLLPDQPILLNNFYSNILIHIPKGPILVVPISNTQTSDIKKQCLMECRMPEFIPVDREWEGVTGVKLTLTKQVQTFHIKGRVFLKDGFAEYLHKTSQQQRSSKVIIKKGNIDLSGFTTPCELALYLPIHGLSEPRKCSCKFTCSGEIDYIYKTSVFVKDPITFPTTVNPIHDNGKWIVSIPITNTVKRTLIINKIFIVVSNDIIASFDEELSLDENETHTIQIEGCENGIGQLSIEFTYNGKVYEYNNTIHFVKIPSLYCVQFSLDKTMIRRGEAISVKLILKSNIDNKHVLIQVESNNTFCVCGFNTRKIQLEVGESLEIDYKFISIHSGYCQLPKFHFIRNDKEVCVEYQNTLQDVIVLQESDWFDVV